MNKIAIIGGGISGLSIAQLLNKDNNVVVFEREQKVGGLIKCERIKGNLYHKVGGHVFNTKRKDVLNWFWTFFDKDTDFTKADRYSIVSMPDNRIITYPIENHAYQFSHEMLENFITDLLHLAQKEDKNKTFLNFEEFLQARFGQTLYKEYFQPYNEKIWRRDLSKVPLSWLAGKLPMPTLKEILYNNFIHLEEKSFVHSSFFYPKTDGSQFIANRFANGLNIRYNTNIEKIEKIENKWYISGECFDKIVYCGNLKDLPKLLPSSVDITSYISLIDDLEFHGTTSVFCQIENNPYSWIYMPSRDYLAHRIICTGNFSPSNNVSGILTGTIEFTDYISKEDIIENLKHIPFSPQYIAHQYTKYTYPIQSHSTKEDINSLKKLLEKDSFYLLGRFAEWEYYNMDAAMGAAIDLYNFKLK